MKTFPPIANKKLCFKTTEAVSILQEVKDEMEKHFNVSWRGKYIDDGKVAIGVMGKECKIPEEINKFLCGLINEAR